MRDAGRAATPALSQGGSGPGLRVLALCSDAWGGEGGIARYNRALTAALAAAPDVAGVRVLVRAVAPTPVPAPPAGVVQDGPRLGKTAYALAAAAAALGPGRPDAIFCGHLNMAALAVALGRATWRPVWLQLHGIEAWQPPASAALRRALSRVALVTAVSRFTRDRFLDWSHLPAGRVRLLPNTVEPVFAPGPEPEGLRAGLGAEGRRVILIVGRLARAEGYKGHAELIAAMPQVLARCPEALLVIAGDGDDRDRLRALAEAGPAARAIRFTGRVAEADLPGLYRLADLFAMPSTGEGFGIVYLEAMASGTPALGLAAGGAVDALDDGRLGLIARPETLAEDIAAALAAPPQRGPNLAAAVQARFGPAAFADRLAGVVAALRAARRGAPLPAETGVETGAETEV